VARGEKRSICYGSLADMGTPRPLAARAVCLADGEPPRPREDHWQSGSDDDRAPCFLFSPSQVPPRLSASLLTKLGLWRTRDFPSASLPSLSAFRDAPNMGELERLQNRSHNVGPHNPQRRHTPSSQHCEES
jgi:hypothetical protein